MGVDLTLTIDHPFRPPSIAAVTRTFEPLGSCFEEVAQHLASDYPHLGLPLEPWLEEQKWPSRFQRGCLRLIAPAGFRMWFGPRAVYMPHVLSFGRFTEDVRWQAILSRFSRGCMRVFGSDEVLYSPSLVKGDEARDGVMDGLGLPEILAVFAERFGPPEDSIEAMSIPGSSRYFVQGMERTQAAAPHDSYGIH